ncbi:MAG: biosynthetic-type acetolactate synthase large subunit [Candidatus Diapherotrites archaeon]
MKGAEAIVKALVAEKVEHVFGFPGGAVIPLYDEFLNYSKQLRHVLVRHEQCAAHAAEGYARASGKVGVCVATSGPGATNLITGIADAFSDSVPIVAFAGQVPTNLIGNDAFQEADMMGLTIPITKHNFQLRNPNAISSTIKKAFFIASSGRKGPVYIDLPKDVQVGGVTAEEKNSEMQGYKPKTEGHPVQVKRAAEMILKAQNPVILAGGGVLASNASRELMDVAEAILAPVATTFMGKGCFPETHPLSMGVCGMHGLKAANYAVVNADLLVAIGCRFSDRITGSTASYAKGVKVIHIDIDSAEIGKNVHCDLPIQGDAKDVLGQLAVVVKAKAVKSRPWAEKMKQLRRECDCAMDLPGNPIEPRKVLLELQKVLKADDIVTTGVGQQQMFAAHYLRRERPGTFISSGGLGTMGFGLPSAIGAKVAKPEVEVFDFDGDGSFQMTMQELATCSQENIKVNAVIMNNAYLGMVRQWLELFHGKRYSAVHLKRVPDFAKLAEAYGLTGITVTKPSELSGAFLRARKSDETVVIDVHVKEESNILPMFAAGASVSEMFGECVPKDYFRK